MKSTWIVTIAAGLVLVLALSQPIVAAPQEDAAAPADAEGIEGGDETEKRKMPIGLYVEVGTGAVDIDALDVSVRTSTTQSSINSMLFEDADARRAAIGWRLPNNKI